MRWLTLPQRAYEIFRLPDNYFAPVALFITETTRSPPLLPSRKDRREGSGTNGDVMGDRKPTDGGEVPRKFTINHRKPVTADHKTLLRYSDDNKRQTALSRKLLSLILYMRIISGCKFGIRVGAVA